MKHKPDPELIDDENPEWTEEDFDQSLPFSALPPEMQQQLTSRPHTVVVETQDTSEFVAVPLSRELVARFSSAGPGWQARINAALAEWLNAHPPSDTV